MTPPKVCWTSEPFLGKCVLPPFVKEELAQHLLRSPFAPVETEKFFVLPLLMEITMDRRNVIAALASSSAALMTTAATHANDKHHTHPQAEELKLSCALICSDCVAYCENCVQGCLDAMADGKKNMMACIQICMDCADVCRACAASDARGGPMSEAIMRLCIESCKTCMAECKKHDHAECEACAKACQLCLKECQAALNV